MGHCSNPSCRYAHSVDELRVAPNLLKSKMCSFFLDGRCVVGKACRFAHSVQELSQSAVRLLSATEDAPRPAGTRKEAVQAFQNGPRPLGLVADTKLSLRQQFALSKVEAVLMGKAGGFGQVVVAASWEDDLQEASWENLGIRGSPVAAIPFSQDSGEAVSSLKQRTSGRPPRSPRGEQKRPRVPRGLVDTLADLDEFPTAVISFADPVWNGNTMARIWDGRSTSASSLPDKGSEKCVLAGIPYEESMPCSKVNTSPGLESWSLCGRHVFVQKKRPIRLDIEEAMEVCRPGSDKFEQLQLVKIHQRQRARGRSEDPMRRTRRASAAPHSTKGAECSFRRENSRCCGAEPARAAERSDGSQPAARSEGNLSQASRADRRELSEQSCLLCQREPVPGCSSQTTPGQPCAACNCGLRVFQHNTFLTVAEEEDEEFQDLPIRRTKSM
ncbi:unnamed protein product [Cladocopium goreaui]|uniref:Cleavage and polyadenylation specificity factor CPSF30 n=1 Tax=Cladocopium goreaui TaxID=2562237 RepID=A0A9P1DIW0_9DINO|nr:unnamed protein product [Cladocopium goreaui]